MDSCVYLRGKLCYPLNRECLFLNAPENCGFLAHYIHLDSITNDLPITAEVKKILTPRMIENWKIYRGGGARHMTARPFEDSVSKVLESRLSPLGVKVRTRKMIEIVPGVRTIMDISIEKPDYPTSLISLKTWIGDGEFRNCFGNAYFIKSMHGRMKIRFYIVVLIPTQISRELVKMAKPFIEGLYSLSEEPYIDDLFVILEGLYDKGNEVR